MAGSVSPPATSRNAVQVNAERQGDIPHTALETAETRAQVYSYFLLLLNIFSIDS